MKIAYLILVHKNPKQLKRLIDKLRFDNVCFYVHVDIKSNLNDFKFFFNDNKNVKFTKNRENGQWGDIGIVKATLYLMQEAFADNCDYYILLSGMDYPIKSNLHIQEFLLLNKGKSFIEYSKLPLSRLNYGGLDRIEGYSYSFFNKRYTYIPYRLKPEYNFKGHVLNVALGLYSFLIKGKRYSPQNISDFYYGSQWWILYRDLIEYILNYLEHDSGYLKYHKYTVLSDELFFQTILINSLSEKHSEIVNNNYRLICWEENSSHPKMLDMEDLDEIMQTDALFARKFDEHSKLLNFIDKNY